jgi:hypothetical protein
MHATTTTTSVLLAIGFISGAEVTMAADDVRLQKQSGTIVIPDSSVAKPEDAGTAAHTNIQIYRPNEAIAPSQPAAKRNDAEK